MTSPCPAGHNSNDPDWCDTCGAPMQSVTGSPAATPLPRSVPGSTSTAAPASSQDPAAAGQPCPSCSELNPSDALFCEGCGLDFVTGQLPSPVSSPAPSSRSAAPATSLPVPSATLEAAEGGASSPTIDPGSELGWVAFVDVDHDWFEAKGESIGTPPARTVVTHNLRHATVMVGRTRSSGALPGIVVDDDHGISRRHAEFRFDAVAGQWSVTDLGSTNGTFVLPAAQAPLPTTSPLRPGETHVLGAGDRVFIGAWTRIEIRPTEQDPVTSPDAASKGNSEPTD